MTKFIGFDAGGFGDCLYEHVSAQKYMFHADMPAVAILPESSSGQIKFSKEAAEDRCAIGIPRPADGIAVLNGNIRRVLLPLIWKKLLSKEEREQTWYKTSCAALTASYIKHLLQETELSAEKQDELCIAIPDHLPQSSQEYLLRNLRKQLGTDNINLIWRHAAIAVQCLDEISQHTELLSLFKQKQRKLTVLYAGADAIEIAAFDIVVQKFFGRTFLIPKRSIPAQDDLLIFDGLDIASSYAAELFPDLPADDLTGMWHVLNCCKAPWLSLNNKDPVQFLHNDNKKFLYFNSKWHSWQEHLLPRATPSPAQSALTRKLFKSEVLQHIYQPEQNEQQRGLASGKKSYIRTKSWQDCLARFVADFIQTHDIDDSMLILAGPMLSSDSICKNIADKLFRSYAPFAELTEHKKHLFKNLWRASEDCVARGAALFSVRLKHKQPSYNDTLEQLTIFCRETNTGNIKPYTLIKNDKVIQQGQPAGIPYTFESDISLCSIRSQTSGLKIFLLKGNFDSEHPDHGIYRKGEVDFLNVVPYDIPLFVKMEIKPASGFASVRFFNRKLKNFGNDVAYKLLTDGMPFDFTKMQPSSYEEIFRNQRKPHIQKSVIEQRTEQKKTQPQRQVVEQRIEQKKTQSQKRVIEPYIEKKAEKQVEKQALSDFSQWPQDHVIELMDKEPLSSDFSLVAEYKQFNEEYKQFNKRLNLDVNNIYNFLEAWLKGKYRNDALRVLLDYQQNVLLQESYFTLHDTKTHKFLLNQYGETNIPVIDKGLDNYKKFINDKGGSLLNMCRNTGNKEAENSFLHSFSLLRGRTPDWVVSRLKKQLQECIDTGNLLNNELFSSIKYCFNSRDSIQLLFDYYMQTINFTTRTGVTVLFTERFSREVADCLAYIIDNYKESIDCLKRHIARQMIADAVCLMDETETSQVKSNFLTATYLILMALKFRSKDLSFMDMTGKYQNNTDRNLIDKALTSIKQTSYVLNFDQTMPKNDREHIMKCLQQYKNDIYNFATRRGSTRVMANYRTE